MRLFNEVEIKYLEGLQEVDGIFTCPVCKKQYKQKKRADAHLEERGCHTFVDLFKGTESEKKMYEIFTNLQAISNQPTFGIPAFRKTKSYSVIARFYTYCLNNNVFDMFHYLNYVLLNTNWNQILHGVSNGMSEVILRKYREYRRKNPDADLNDRYFRTFVGKLLTDTEFALRSLERGDISIDYFFGRTDLDSFIEKLSEPERHRLSLIIKDL